MRWQNGCKYSARLDVSPEGVSSDRILDPKLKYINGSSEEILLKQEEDLKLASEIFGSSEAIAAIDTVFLQRGIDWNDHKVQKEIKSWQKGRD